MEYLSEIVAFFLGGGLGSLLTLKLKKQSASARGNMVDQERSSAGGDIVGRDKINK